MPQVFEFAAFTVREGHDQAMLDERPAAGPGRAGVSAEAACESLHKPVWCRSAVPVCHWVRKRGNARVSPWFWARGGPNRVGTM